MYKENKKRALTFIPQLIFVFFCAWNPHVAAETMPIDLGGALRLADERNLDITIYLEKVSESSARLEQSRVLAIPTLRFGGSYNDHSGPLQETDGTVVGVDRDATQLGFGSGSVGAGDPRAPGLSLDLNVADAYFEPLLARQDRNAAVAVAAANRLQVIEDVATAYYRLSQSHAELAITEENLLRAEELAEITADFAQIGQGLSADAALASAQTFIWRQRLEAARVNADMSSLALVQILHLDNNIELVPSDAAVQRLDIFNVDEDIDFLITQALNNRPETEQHDAQLLAAEQGIKQETYGPLIPRLSVNYSNSSFGGSSSTVQYDSSQRDDFSIMLYWQLDNFGFSRHARLEERQANIRSLQSERDKTLDQIVAEVRGAYLRVQSQRRQLELTQQAVAVASNAYTLVRERIFENQGLPMEALQSMQFLADAQSQRLLALINYNLAQIQLHTALGNPVSDGLGL